jgi:phosphoribosylaminoimidazole-succinocarboxamide synthase
VLIEFRDDITAGDGARHDVIAGKGPYNCQISSKLFGVLERAGIATHFVRQLSNTEMLCKSVDIVPIEVIVRNIAAGTLVKKFPFELGMELPNPIVNLDLKNDTYHDPMLNTDIALALGLANLQELRELREMGLRVNEVLTNYFDGLGLILVDFKIEIGRAGGKLLVADEVSPDTCRLWDKKTRESLDKDVYRQNKGDVLATYKRLSEIIMAAK